MSDPRTWEVYIVEADSGALYTGISTDVERRLAEHRDSPRGARFFRFAAAVQLVYRERCRDRSEATRRERAIKAMRREEKLHLIRSAAKRSD